MSQAALSGLVDGQLGRVMALARRHLEMDVVYLSEFTDGRQVYRALDGDAESFGLSTGTGPLLAETYCARMVQGEIPSIIPDSTRDVRVRALQTTLDGPIGAYIGVPVTLPDGTLYGTFCCLSHQATPDLHLRDVKFMAMLAELIGAEVEEKRQRDLKHDRIAALVADQRVTLALQPVVDLNDGRCIGVEVLSRFPADAGPPDIVFAAAHEVGLGVELERMVVGKAIALLPTLPPDQVMALNLSPASAFELAGLPVAATHPLLGRIVLEITEHDAVESYAELRDRLRPLRERGLRLAIDDAGAGYASLHHIIELKPDVIKIDRSIIDGLATDPARCSVVRSLVLLALDLQALVVAEGVETVADLKAASALGVHAAQGYLIARPTTDHSQALRWATSADMLAE